MFDTEISNYYYEAIKEEMYSKLISACSVDVLQHLEYLDANEFRHVIQNSKISYYSGDVSLIGRYRMP